MHLNFSCCCLRQFAARKITFRRWNKMQRRKLTWSRSSVWTKTKADSTTLKCLHFNCSTALLWNLHKNSILNAIEARELLHAAIEDRQRVPSNIMSSRKIIAKRIKKFMTISLKLEVAAISSQVRISVQRKMNSLFISRSETMIEWEEGIQTNLSGRDQGTRFVAQFSAFSALALFGLRRWKISEILDQTKVICDYRNFLFRAIFQHHSSLPSGAIWSSSSAATEAACNRLKCNKFHWFALFSGQHRSLCNRKDANFHRKIASIIQLM